MIDKKGMTLVEVIVAFAIIAIVSVVVVSALVTSGNAKMKGDAFTLAEEQLTEAIAAGANADTTAVNDLSVLVNTPSGPKTITIPGYAYTYDDEKYDKTFRIVGWDK
jgi:prepilin-type N-terminal cleavage/methylation domain-containing protein